jgi:DNA-dependent protein kinase catalytic subunit
LFFKPIATLIVSGGLGTSINYFVRDLCILLLRWKGMRLDEESDKLLLTQLVVFLMKHCAHEKKFILKGNLELIKLLVERFRDKLAVGLDIILGWLRFDEKKREARLARITGLQLLAVLVANDISPYNKSQDSRIISENKFFDSVLECLLFTFKDVYDAAAEVCGMLLSFIAMSNVPHGLGSFEDENTPAAYFYKSLKARLNKFVTEHKYDVFLCCLNKIAIHFPNFLDNYLPGRILEILPNLFGVYRRMAM